MGARPRSFPLVRMNENKVRTKDSCWSVGTIYDPRELPGVSTASLGIGRGVTSGPWDGDILAQGLIELIEYPYQQGASSFLEAYLERTSQLSVFGLEQFGMGDRL